MKRDEHNGRATRPRYAVIGGGISGVAVTWYLRRHGIDVEILERDDHLGGRVGPGVLNGVSIDFGGKNVGRSYHRFRAFTHSLGHNPYIYFGMNSSRVENGQIITLDARRRWRAMRELLGHCSARDAQRFLRMVAAIKADEDNAFIGGPYFEWLRRRYDDAVVTEYFTPELLRLLLRPMVLRMNGAEPDEIHLGSLGTNVRLLFDEYEQLELGMGRSMQMFANQGPVRFNTEVQELLVENGRAVGVRARDEAGTHELRYDGVVVALPAPAAATLLEPVAATAAQTLRKVRYFPVTTVIAQYQRDVFTADMRALRFDEGSPLSNAGVYGIGKLDFVRYTFSGRAARPLLTGVPDAERLLLEGEKRLHPIVPVRASERVAFGARSWTTGLCAYARDQHALVQDVRQAAGRIDGLHLTGDYMRGVSLEACFKAGEDCAAEIAGAPSAGRRWSERLERIFHQERRAS
jgi:oxygen-dependent protoporphyrinogen oxidase